MGGEVLLNDGGGGISEGEVVPESENGGKEYWAERGKTVFIRKGNEYNCQSDQTPLQNDWATSEAEERKISKGGRSSPKGILFQEGKTVSSSGYKDLPKGGGGIFSLIRDISSVHAASRLRKRPQRKRRRKY